MAASAHNPFPRSPNSSIRSLDSSSVSSATSPRPPQYLCGIMSSTSRPGGGLPQPYGHPSLPPVSSGSGYPPYGTLPSNAVFGRDSFPSADSVASTPGSSHSHLVGPPGMGSQKRAYRQRRKDPSCDACRERKVKCDATETTSCSECSSRNVKCQFTKETNRRMSSIKQVQDLEKQMNQVKQENSHLRRKLEVRDGSMEVESEPIDDTPLQLPPIGAEPKRIERPSQIPELAGVRASMRNLSKGVYKPPPQYRATGLISFDPPRPELPSRHGADHLLQSYQRLAHTMFPIIHWPTFQASIDDLYGGRLSKPSPSFLSLFFVVLATGSLFTTEPPTSDTFFRPADLLEASRKMTDPWNNEYDLNNARTALLTALCLNEMNLKSAAWNMLGSAVRIGQDLGLHIETGPWPFIEGEMRRRTWWAIYILDRLLASELGHPPSIDDVECDVSLPAGVDDQYIRSDGMLVPNGAQPLTHSLLAVIHVVRSYTALLATLSSKVVSQERLSTFDNHFRQCLESSFPPQCYPSSNLPLAPHFLGPLAYLLHARMLLNRHNLSPRCSSNTRLSAVGGCTLVALDTAALIQRCNASLDDGATALLATHVFRSTLFLLLTGYFDQAATCIRALASISTRRDVAIACGRYLSFYTATLSSKRAEHADHLQRARPSLSLRSPQEHHNAILQSIAADEELIAYTTADLQGLVNHNWLWAGLEREINLERTATSSGPPSSSTSLHSSEARMGLTSEESREWGGWARLEAAARALAPPTTPSAGTAPTSTPPGGGWPTLPPPQIKSEPSSGGMDLPRLSDAPRYASESARGLREGSGTGSPSTGDNAKRGADRLSIANII